MTRDTLAGGYEGLVCDLDGVVYRGGEAVPGAVEALGAARRAGLRIAYATNNASRPPQEVSRQLRSLGLELDDAEVVTSSQAGARHLRERLDAGTVVLAVGGQGVALALREAGLEPVRADELADRSSPPAAVLQGFGPDVSWRDLSEAAFAIHAGATWVATNDDSTIPTDRGIAPGNGSLVGVVRAAVDVDPVVVGKPHPPLYELAAAVLDLPVARTLAVGDRLDTDLEGAVATGMDGLFVLTGVSRLGDVALAPRPQRPRYLAVDLGVLGEPYEEATADLSGDTASGRCGAARARVGPDGVRAGDDGSPSERLRAVVAAAWALADTDRSAVEAVEPAAWRDAERHLLAGEPA